MGWDTKLSLVDESVKNYDRYLYAERPKVGGCIHIYRRHEMKLAPPHFIFALTDNWQANGVPREWGLEPIKARLQAIDLWRDDRFVENIIKDYEKDSESKDRARLNSTESFLKDFRSQFKKTFAYTNTSNLEKIDKRRNHKNG